MNKQVTTYTLLGFQFLKAWMLNNCKILQKIFYVGKFACKKDFQKNIQAVHKNVFVLKMIFLSANCVYSYNAIFCKWKSSENLPEEENDAFQRKHGHC